MDALENIRAKTTQYYPARKEVLAYGYCSNENNFW